MADTLQSSPNASVSLAKTLPLSFSLNPSGILKSMPCKLSLLFSKENCPPSVLDSLPNEKLNPSALTAPIEIPIAINAKYV